MSLSTIHQGSIRVLNLGFGVKTKPSHFPLFTWRNLTFHTSILTLPPCPFPLPYWPFFRLILAITPFFSKGMVPIWLYVLCWLFLARHPERVFCSPSLSRKGLFVPLPHPEGTRLLPSPLPLPHFEIVMQCLSYIWLKNPSTYCVSKYNVFYPPFPLPPFTMVS